MTVSDFLGRFPELGADVSAIEFARVARLDAEKRYLELRATNAELVSPIPVGAVVSCGSRGLGGIGLVANERFRVEQIFFESIPYLCGGPVVVLRGRGFGDYAKTNFARYLPLGFGDDEACLVHAQTESSQCTHHRECQLAAEFVAAKRARMAAIRAHAEARRQLCEHEIVQYWLAKRAPCAPGATMNQPGRVPYLGWRMLVSGVRAVLDAPMTASFEPSALTWEVSGQQISLFNQRHPVCRSLRGPRCALVPA